MDKLKRFLVGCGKGCLAILCCMVVLVLLFAIYCGLGREGILVMFVIGVIIFFGFAEVQDF